MRGQMLDMAKSTMTPMAAKKNINGPFRFGAISFVEGGGIVAIHEFAGGGVGQPFLKIGILVQVQSPFV